jgi:hypothetical protein
MIKAQFKAANVVPELALIGSLRLVSADSAELACTLLISKTTQSDVYLRFLTAQH